MARPNTRATLIQYCLRVLGEPVVEVNIDDDQIEDRVDEAIQYYQEYHSDAVERTYLKHQLTAADVANGYITLPEALLSVLRVFPISTMGFGSNDILQTKFQSLAGLYGNMAQGGQLVDLEMTRQYMSLIDMTVNGLSQLITFSRHKNTLRIEVNWAESNLTEGQYIIIEGYTAIDPNTYPDIYNDMMLKKYATALLKRQWGANLIKFEGMQLPGGVTINGRSLFDDANADIQKIEDEFDSKYSFPPDFFVG